jgi:hypothetical protein
MQVPNQDKAKSSAGRKTAATLFAAAALVALGFSAYYGRQRYLREHPPPLPNVIAPLSPEDMALIRKGFPIVRKTVLHTTPEQDAKLDALWAKPPRSLEEVIRYEQMTNTIMTTSQLVLYRPMRKRFEHRVIDKMLEPLGKRTSGPDFKKLSDEVKRRVDERIDGKAD